MTTEALKAALGHLEIDDNPVSVRAKSRDFFWYSPVLKARMDHLTADFVVSPKSEAEVVEVLRLAHHHDVPVTVRGAGTGNYGQAMPMRGGVVLHMKHLNKVRAVLPGRVIVEPGCILRDLDAATRAHSGQELRMHPSTYTTATIGGFIGGGSGGIGSCTWGVLRDLGNILRLRVVTAEAEPQVIEFTGEELHRVSHAYGTNGVITEVEVPLAPAYDWIDILVTHRDFATAVQIAGELGHQDGILKKLISVYEAP
ncbi:MAG: FAD-linked oxidase, partial [Rhodobacterales bacterium 17-64-5]